MLIFVIERAVVSLVKRKKSLEENLAKDYLHLAPHDIKARQDEINALNEENGRLVTQYRITQRTKIRRSLIMEDPTRRKFWGFLRKQIRRAGQITALRTDDGAMVFGQEEVEETVLNHFSNVFHGQRNPVEPDSTFVVDEVLAQEEIAGILAQEQIRNPPNTFEEEVCAPYSFSELNKNSLTFL